MMSDFNTEREESLSEESERTRQVKCTSRRASRARVKEEEKVGASIQYCGSMVRDICKVRLTDMPG